MILNRCWLLILSLLACAASTDVVMARTVHPIYGSEGMHGVIPIPNLGAALDECPAGSYFTGVVGNVGAWIDQITVVCSKLKPDGSFGGGKSLPSRGGTGGGFKQALCPANEIVTSFDIGRNSDYRLTHFRLTCSNPKTLAKHSVYFVSKGYDAHYNTAQGCRSGELGGGLDIRYGEFVNGLGLICSDFAAVVVKQDQKPASSGCLIGGIVRKDIADADCKEAQTTGCVRHLLTSSQYTACLAAQKPAKDEPKPDVKKAKVVAANKVYKKRTEGDTAANTVCAVRPGDTADVLGTGPDKWVRLGNISGACAGKSGFAWNDGEIVLP